MKNKKIIALLCAMTMIMTVLSSIIVVNAADGIMVSMSAADKKNDDGSYTVTVSYEGLPSDKTLRALTINIPIDEDKMEVVNAEAIKDGIEIAGAKYNANQKRFVITGVAIAEGQNLMKTPKGTLATFDVKVKGEQDVELNFATAKFTLDADEYAMDKDDLKVNVSNTAIDYVKDRGEEKGAVTMSAVQKSDDEYTVTVSYDLEKFTGFEALRALTINIPIDEDKMEVVNAEAIKDGIEIAGAKYNANQKRFVITGVAIAEGQNLMKTPKGTLATFDVKLKPGVSAPKLAFSTAKFTLDSTEYTMADEIYTNTVRLKPGSSEPTVEPTVEPTTEPTTDPDATTKPDATDKPSATAAPKPIKIEKPTEVTIGGLKDAKAYSIKLSDIAAETGAEMPEKVNIVIQGFDKKNVAIGYVVIPDISDFTKEYMGYVSNAAKTRINVLDAETGDPVAQVYEIK